MIEHQCENLWTNNSGSGLVHLPTEDYGAAPDESAKQALILQHCIRYKIMVLWTNNYLTTKAKRKLRAFINSYTFKNQYDGSAILFFMVKMVRPDTRAE